MTKSESRASVGVQGDREVCAEFGKMIGRLTQRDAEAVLAGEWYSTKDIQFFASYRHRLAGQDRGEGAASQAVGKGWPNAWRHDGFNHAITQAQKALRYLAENDRPSGGEQFPNSASCYMIADELEITRKTFAKALSTESPPVSDVRDLIVAGLRAWVSSTPDIDLSPRMMREAADFIMGQPGSQALAHAAVGEGWRPIERAPKDGTVFHGWMDGTCEKFYWQDADGDQPVGWRTFMWVFPEGKGPTHWMPLPASPLHSAGER